MSAAGPSRYSKIALEAKLKELRDCPVGKDGLKDEDLMQLYTALMEEIPKNGVLHWFCDAASPLVNELAVMLTRLRAYAEATQYVKDWEKRLGTVLHSCSKCVKALDLAKVSSRETYYGAFKPHILDRFWNNFEQLEVQLIIDKLGSLGPSSDIPSALTYHILSKAAAFSNTPLLQLVSSRDVFQGPAKWSMHPPPPGYFILTLHEDGDIRKWALEHLQSVKYDSKQGGITIEQFKAGYEVLLLVLVQRLVGSSYGPEVLSPQASQAQNISTNFPFTPSLEIAWKGFTAVLRVLSDEVIEKYELHRVVLTHLHDTEAHFTEVLRAMAHILRKMQGKLWINETDDFPQVVFDSIKDNPKFSELILTHDPHNGKAWHLLMFMEFLWGVWNIPSFGDVLAKFVAFTCEELQHERFQIAQAYVMDATAQILSAAISRAKPAKFPEQRKIVLKIINIHSDAIAHVALDSEIATEEKWTEARRSARTLLRAVLKSDVAEVTSAFLKVSALDPASDSESVRKLAPTIEHHMWSKVYSSMRALDDGAIIMIIEIASLSALWDKLHKQAVARPIWKHYKSQKADPPQVLLTAIADVANGINSTLNFFREGFLDLITRFANAHSARELREQFDRSELVRNTIFLLLSPVEDFNVAAQTIISQGWDVDGRVECLGILLRKYTPSCFRGLIDYMTKFDAYVQQVPEASNASKALVRCMTDVIEVLGKSPDALLKDRSFVLQIFPEFTLKEEVPKLWRAMTIAISVIFKNTPSWSDIFPRSFMTEWMRDALIFARDLLECRKPFEAVTMSNVENDTFISSPRKQSRGGKKMVEDLQDMLMSLQSWLRITDTEILYQSFNIFKTLCQCFKEADVLPSPDALSKLSRFIELNKTSPTVKRSYLNQVDLAELEVAVADFEEKEDEDDEVQILSYSWKDKGKKREKESSSEVEEVAPPRKLKPATRVSTKNRKEKEPVKVTNQTILPFGQKIKSALPEPKFEGSTKRRPSSPPTSRTDSSESSSESDEMEELFGSKNVKRVLPKFNKVRRPASRSSSLGRSMGDEDVDIDIVGDTYNQGSSGATVQEARRREEAKRMEAFRKKDAARKPTERRKVLMYEDPALIKAREAEKERIRERARKKEEALRQHHRMKPDLTPLHETLLSWNYDHKGDEPPSGVAKESLKRIPDVFSGQAEYLKVFQPLLTLECWSQIAKSKEEATADICYSTIQNRSHLNIWLELDVLVDSPPKPDWRLSPDVDVVLLRHSENSISIMAKVKGFSKTLNGIQVNLLCCTRALSQDPGLTIGSVWLLNYIFSLSTLHREFGALMALPYCDMAKLIYKPVLSDPVETSSVEIRKTMKAYRVNEPQAKAIHSAMQTNGFSLIQGPPGTGKTWTILGLVGAFLSSRKKPPAPVNVPGRAPPKPIVEKILLCAPSNAAIDEIAKRLMEGVRNSSGQTITPKVVRVGSESQINASVKDIALDNLVTERLAEEGQIDGDDSSEIAVIRAEIEGVKATKQKKQDELHAINNNAAKAQALEEEIRSLNSRRVTLSQRLDKLYDDRKSQNRSFDTRRRQYRFDILNEADVVCSTLSGAGHEQLSILDFSMVIIDEAAQAVELSSLIPLKYQCPKYIMVGDPQQLPPTVLSPEAQQWGYDQSLFVRMQRSRPNAVHLLSIQYRMHPSISKLPSTAFYGGRLRDGPDMDKKTAQIWHNDARFGVYKFFNASHGREEQSLVGHSIVNREETKIIVAIFENLRRTFPAVNFDYRIGIVSMYRAQLLELKRLFQARYTRDILGKVDFNTVDGFQGQEKDIIILSCVRAGPNLNSIGFLSDTRRMNVAITRARSSLYIVGHAATLERSDKTWKRIVEDARTRSCLVELRDNSYFSQKTVQSHIASMNGPLGVLASDQSASKSTESDMDSKTSGKRIPKGPRVKQLKPENVSTVDSNQSSPAAVQQSISTDTLNGSAPVPSKNSPLQTRITESPLEDGELQETSPSAGPSNLKKRGPSNEFAPRPPPAKRMPEQARPHPPPKRTSSEQDKKRAQRDLEALQRRKQQSSLFIKK